MEFDYTFTMSLAFLSLVAIALIGAHTFYVIQDSNANTTIKVMYPILFTVFGLLMFSSLHNIQGYPVKQMFPNGWIYHDHIENGDNILVIMESDKLPGEYRFFEVDRNLDNSEALNEAGEQSERGMLIQMRVANGEKIKGWEIMNPAKFYTKDN